MKKPTPDLSKKTKAELTAMARRKKIAVTSGMLKDELVKAVKKGLRKIEAQKKTKTAKKISKKKSPKISKSKTLKKPKSAARKTTEASKIKTTVKKRTTPKSSSAKGMVKKSSRKKPATLKPKTVLSPNTIKRQEPPKLVGTPSDLPERYNDHRLVVLARDPNWAYAYWDLNKARVQDLLSKIRQPSTHARWVLRVFSAELHPTGQEGHYFDIDIDLKSGSYYLDLSRPGARFIVEIGVIDSTGMFRATAQSSPVILPSDHPSETTAPEGTAPQQASASSPDRPGFTKPSSSRSK